MNSFPRFRPGLSSFCVPGTGVFLVGETGSVLVTGSLFEHLCPALEHKRSVAQIVTALDGVLSPAEIYYGLDWLAARGHLAPDEPTGVELQLKVIGTVARDGVDVAFRDAGFRLVADAAPQLVLVDDYLNPGIAHCNQAALKAASVWMPCKPGGALSWWGPIFVPGAGPCWECLATRLRDNRPVENFLRQRGIWPEEHFSSAPETPSAFAAGSHLAAQALARWLAEDRPSELLATLWTLDHRTQTIDAHPVSRRPSCAACGTPRVPSPQSPVVLREGLSRVLSDNGHRSVTAEQTFQRLQQHISPLTGIVSSLGPLPDRPALRPVYGARYLVCPVEDSPSFDDFHRSSLGKGRIAAQSRTSALCEALERWSSIARPDHPRRRASLAALGKAAVSPASLLNFSESQYAQRESRNKAETDARRQVPAPASSTLELDWTAMWSLSHARTRYVPSTYCYSHLRVAPAEAVCTFNPNGHAAGNGLEEAILQAFLELVERDAVALWWYSRALRPGVALASFDAPWLLELRRHYAELGWDLWALDITTDLEIPSFVGVARERTGQRWAVGFGCHLEAGIALQRALTEVNQLFGLDASRDLPWSGGALADEAFLLPCPALGERSQRDYPTLDLPDLAAEVQLCVDRASRAGLETLVLDLSQAEVDLTVVKVVVPGLRHFWPRFGPGRLYEVPLALGWLKRQLGEDELNPAHLFL